MGVVSLTLLMLQGGSYLAHRTNGVLQTRVKKINQIAGAINIVCFTVAGLWLTQMNGLSVVNMADPNLSMNPLMKEVAVVSGGWLTNYFAHPILWIFPALVYVGVLLTLILQNVLNHLQERKLRAATREAKPDTDLIQVKKTQA